MHEQNTLMYNIILFENELKMEKFDLNIVQRKTWWRMSLLKALSKQRHHKLINMFGLEIS
jgi:hypothetical protein